MISTFRFSATGGGASLTYAEVGTVPAAANTTRKDSDANITGGGVKSVAGPIKPSAGRAATTTSSVETVGQRSNLTVMIDVTGAGMKATGFAQHGLQYVSHSPASFLLDIEALELDGDHASLDFRVEQPQDGDHLRELSEEIVPSSLPENCDFERVPGHVTLFRLQAKFIMHGNRPRLQIHSSYEHDCVTVKPKISSRDFEFDQQTRIVRYRGHLDEHGNRVRTIKISIDPGRTSDENNLILTLLGTQSSKKYDSQSSTMKKDSPDNNPVLT
ncbi:hypothetical protein IAD21_05969 [Abditibacteriota bacterium]|nr:hypothetical protein IAD21_05969 [Abditibacteriota bacterium]